MISFTYLCYYCNKNHPYHISTSLFIVSLSSNHMYNPYSLFGMLSVSKFPVLNSFLSLCCLLLLFILHIFDDNMLIRFSIHKQQRKPKEPFSYQKAHPNTTTSTRSYIDFFFFSIKFLEFYFFCLCSVFFQNTLSHSRLLTLKLEYLNLLYLHFQNSVTFAYSCNFCGSMFQYC